MGYYAAFLDITGKRCLVVGTGPAAEDKARGLREAGAEVLTVTDEEFVEADLNGCTLVIDASTDEASGVRVAYAARRRGVLVNVLDRPALCDFIAPALVRHGPLQVAISTSGRSPFMASHLRRRLEDSVGPEWGELTELVGRLRDELRERKVPREKQEEVYARVPASGALELLREGRREEAELVLRALISPH